MRFALLRGQFAFGQPAVTWGNHIRVLVLVDRDGTTIDRVSTCHEVRPGRTICFGR
jgi:hypothetical protein